MADMLLNNLGNYNSYFINKATNALSSDYAMASTDAEWEKISALSGDPTDVDTPLEIAMLSTCAGVVDIRPIMPPEVEAILPKNDPRLSDLKLGAAVLKELTELRFLDPNNRNAIGRYEGMIKFITDRGNVSRAEIQQYLRGGIYALTLEQFNKIDFGLEHNTRYYNVTLNRNPNTKEFTLNYDRGRISGTNLNALLTAMRGNREFNALDIEQVETMAGLIPAVVYAGWLADGTAMGIDAIKLAADTIADYYLNPTQENYNLLAGVYGQFRRGRNMQDPIAEAGYRAYDNLLSDLNKNLRNKAYDDNILRGAALAQAAQARNSAYGVFAIQDATGGGGN
jgi:hypothetical protein